MPVVVNNPVFKVTLTKLVQRKNGVADRFAKGATNIDLTAFLGDGTNITTDKSIYADQGSFTISFSDHLLSTYGDSIYAAIEPMDFITIYANKVPQPAGKNTVVMRGFVMKVDRSETMTEEGPRRFVTIQGADGGALFAMTRVIWQALAVAGEGLMSSFQLNAVLGITDYISSPGDFATAVVSKVINKKLAALIAISSQVVPPVATDAINVSAGSVFAGNLAEFQGSMYELIASIADRPWNELFMRDDDDTWRLVFRPAPWHGIDGKLVLLGAAEPGNTALLASDIISMNLSRSIEGVANFFFVDPNGRSINSPEVLNAWGLVEGANFTDTNPNSNPTLYGRRMMSVPTVLFGTGQPAQPSGATADQRTQADASMVDWFGLRLKQLIAMNQDNVVFENGVIQIVGNEAVKPGTYVVIQRGNIVFEAYVHQVTHQIDPITPRWTTNLGVTRCTSFLVRNKQQGAPWFGEGRMGAFTP